MMIDESSTGDDLDEGPAASTGDEVGDAVGVVVWQGPAAVHARQWAGQESVGRGNRPYSW